MGCYRMEGSFTFSLGECLRNKVKNIPEGYGVYKIYSNSKDGELLYIGKGGTIMNDGTFGKQNLRRRLVNIQDGKRREDFFVEKLKINPQIKQLYIEWIILGTDILPAYVEAQLIQEYYAKHLKLPLWNKNF